VPRSPSTASSLDGRSSGIFLSVLTKMPNEVLPLTCLNVKGCRVCMQIKTKLMFRLVKNSQIGQSLANANR
jgi:hypothetical protein